MKKLFTIITTGVLLVAVATLSIHIASLGNQIQTLKGELAKSTKQLAAFERSYCSTGAADVRDGVTIRHTLQVDDQNRSYQVHIPPHYDPSIRYPVIVNFDGIEGSGDRMEAYSGVDALPVIAVYPDSIAGTRGFTAWQGAPYSLKGDYDLKFVEAMLDELPTNYCIDTTRTFAIGMSNGGGLAMLASCELPSKFKAVATVSGAYYESCRTKERMPSVLALHSTTDKQVPFMGSPQRKLPKVLDWARSEARARNCVDASRRNEPNNNVQYDWTNCRDSTQVRLVVLRGQDHGWLYLPKSAQNTQQNLTQYIWTFFKEAV